MLDFGTRTQAGLRHSTNEDVIHASVESQGGQEVGCFVVANPMQSGQNAATVQKAVDTVVKAVRQSAPSSMLDTLKAALQGSLADGVAISAAVVIGTQANIAYIGGNRIYLVTPERIEQVTHGQPQKIETLTRHLSPGSRLLLCSDGIWKAIDDVDLYKIVMRHSPQAACTNLGTLVNARGGEDNSSAIVVSP